MFGDEFRFLPLISFWLPMSKFEVLCTGDNGGLTTPVVCAADILPPGAVPATYADDTTLYVLIPSVNHVHAATSCSTLQTGMDALAEWGTTWRIQFEPSNHRPWQYHSPPPSVAHPCRVIWWTERWWDCYHQAPRRCVRQVHELELQKSPALSRNACCATSRLPAQSMLGSRDRHLRPAHGVQRLRQTLHGVGSALPNNWAFWHGWFGIFWLCQQQVTAFPWQKTMMLCFSNEKVHQKIKTGAETSGARGPGK